MGVRVGVEVGMGVGVLSCNPSRTFGHLLAIVDLLCFAPPPPFRTLPSVALPLRSHYLRSHLPLVALPSVALPSVALPSVAHATVLEPEGHELLPIPSASQEHVSAAANP